MTEEKMKWFSCFYGHVFLPARFGSKKAEAIAKIAWAGGISEEDCVPFFQKWFRMQTVLRPHLFHVKVFDIYPVDEFHFLGKYQSHREVEALSQELPRKVSGT